MRSGTPKKVSAEEAVQAVGRGAYQLAFDLPEPAGLKDVEGKG